MLFYLFLFFLSRGFRRYPVAAETQTPKIRGQRRLRGGVLQVRSEPGAALSKEEEERECGTWRTPCVALLPTVRAAVPARGHTSARSCARTVPCPSRVLPACA